MLETASDGRRLSYAQNGEDIVLLRAFGEQGSGVWVDVGANHPFNDSVTKNFSDMGWSGINVEPVRSLHDQLAAHRPRDVNLCAAVSDHEGSMTFYRNDSNLDLSTFHPGLVERYRARGDVITEVEVPVATLAGICEEHLEVPVIDFLKVDTEGHEAAVLRGHDFARFPVRVACIESTADEAGEIPVLLRENGMHHVAFDGLNSWYTSEQEAATLGPKIALPPSPVLDWYHPQVYWGMLAAKDERIAALEQRLESLGAKPPSIAQRRRVTVPAITRRLRRLTRRS